MKIYSTEYPSQLPPFVVKDLLERVPASIRQKAGRYRRWQDAYGCLFGRLLLWRGLTDLGYAGDLNDLRYSAYGKPYLDDGPYFNISHSGNRVACILSNNGPIGIDLEKISDQPIPEYKEQFSDCEWNDILNAPAPLAMFYHYWTAKESILKADGRGLNLDLGALDVTGPVAEVDSLSWNLRPITSFRDYACHIAYQAATGIPEIEDLFPGSF